MSDSRKKSLDLAAQQKEADDKVMQENLALIAAEKQQKQAVKESKKTFDRTEKIESVADSADQALRVADVIAKADLGWVSAFTSILTLPIHIYKVVHGSILSKAGNATRTAQVLGGIVGIGLGILAFVGVFILKVIAAPFIVLGTTLKATVEAGFELGKRFVNYFFLHGKTLKKERAEKKAEFFELAKDKSNMDALKMYRADTQDKSAFTSTQKRFIQLDQDLTRIDNKRTRMREKIGCGFHRLFKAFLGLAGAILLFIIPPVGAKILLASAAYNVADAAGVNPLRLICRGINTISKKVSGKDLDPFAQKEHHLSIENIERKVAKKQVGQPVERTAHLESMVIPPVTAAPVMPTEISSTNVIAHQTPQHTKSIADSHVAEASIFAQHAGKKISDLPANVRRLLLGNNVPTVTTRPSTLIDARKQQASREKYPKASKGH